MNRRMVFYMMGQMLKVCGALMVLPLIVSLIYSEKCAVDFLISIAVALGIGFPMAFFSRTEDRVIYAKEGFVIVALAWLALSVVGALPFLSAERFRLLLTHFLRRSAVSQPPELQS